MNMRSPNLAQMEAAWQAYIAADPELRCHECRKRAIAHRRMRQEHAKQVREQAGREIVSTLTEFAIRFTICAVGVALFVIMLFCG